MFAVLRPHPAQRVAPQAAHDADDDRHRGGDPRLRPAAHGGRRLVRGRRTPRVDAPDHAQRDLARVLAAAQLRAEAAAGAGRRRRSPAPTGSAASTSRESNFFPQFAIRGATLPRHVPRVPALRGRAQGVPAATGRARSSGASSPTSTASRSATRFRCAARSSPALGVHGARRSTTARTPRPTRRSSSSTGTTSTRRSSALSAARRPGGRVRRRDPRSDAGRRDLAAHRRDVQELAGRDADRDREGVPARLRRHDRGDRGRRSRPCRSSSILIIMAVMANTMAMTARERYARVRDDEGARLRPRFVARPDLRRVRGDRAGRRRARHCADVPGGGCVRRRDGHAVPGVLRLRGDVADAGRRPRSLVGVVAALIPACAPRT